MTIEIKNGKIARIYIKDYKILRDFTLDLTDENGEPLNTVVLAGVNGSGKTSVLECARTNQVDVFHSKSTNPFVFERVSPTPSGMHFQYSQIEHNINNYIDIRMESEDNLDKTVREAMQAAIDDINRTFSLLELNVRLAGRSKFPGKVPVFENFQNQKIKITELSSGEQQVFVRALGLKVDQPKNGVILIDEPENSLHPSWQQKILPIYEAIAKEGDNQLIVATHSPQVIASADVKSIILLKPNRETKKIEVSSPKYSKGHTINYVLSEIMGADYRDTKINNAIEEYLSLIRKGQHESKRGRELAEIIDALDPNSEDRIRVDFALRRFKAIGK